MQQRYRVLRVVATIFKVIAVIVLLVGILGACGALAFGAVPGLAGAGSNSRDAFGVGVGGILVGVGVLFASLLYFLLFYAFGDVMSLLIALEENTRITAERLTGRSASETAVTYSPTSEKAATYSPPPMPPTRPPRAGG